MRSFIIAAIMLLSNNVAFSQIDLTKSRIIADTTIKIDRIAALLMQDHIKKISCKDVVILNDTKPKKGDIVIGKSNLITNSKITTDGFSISTTDGNLRIVAGEGKGSVYGVCDVLEKYFGVKYWSPQDIEIPKNETMILAENIEYIEIPAFEHRQVNGYGTSDLAYRTFNRLETPEEIFVNGYFVHTLGKLVPPDVYGQSNPEYFALINGERRPGAGTQLCLTNEDVFNIIVHKVDSLFKADPTRNILSVSQNDGKFAHCTCDNCKAIDEREESLMGSILQFVNRVAERFPDKEISTLSYLYSVETPKYLKPLPNVNIMLCNIDCTRDLPLEQSTKGAQSGLVFLSYLEKWAQVSNNIFMWDYGINFSNTTSPFPNFHVLQPNMQQFHKNNVTKIFEQVNGSKGVDFSELRSYMLAKLAWNPYQDGDALMKEFVWGYYKEAAPYIYDYLKLQQGGLIASGISLWIFDAVPTHKTGFLRPALIKEYNRLFERAEEAVKHNEEILDRVKLSRLTLQYAELEIARTIKGQHREEMKNKVAFFKERVLHTGLKALDERGGSALVYCDDYLTRFLPSEQINKASGAKIEWISGPSKRYVNVADEALTDGLFGGNTFVESWIGWEGDDAEFILDLGKETEVSSVEIDCLHQLGQWVFAPSNVVYETSNDNIVFKEFGSIERPLSQEHEVLFKQFKVEKSPVKARYVKVKVKGIASCPVWAFGVGNPGWIFIDEVTVL